MKLYAINVPSSNHQVWLRPPDGIKWRHLPLTDEVYSWLNENAGVLQWFETPRYARRSKNDNVHISSDFEFKSPVAAMLFKLTWGGV